MTYKIEMTINNDEIIDIIEFETFKEFIHFYNDTDRIKEYRIKYRGCILRSYEVYPDYDHTQNELRQYFRIFPDNPNDYIQTLPTLESSITTTEKKESSKSPLLGSIILGVLLFPIFLICGAINSSK